MNYFYFGTIYSSGIRSVSKLYKSDKEKYVICLLQISILFHSAFLNKIVSLNNNEKCVNSIQIECMNKFNRLTLAESCIIKT